MKLLILPFLFFCLSTILHAQSPLVTAGNPRAETYTYIKGGDSVRFTILGKNDTLKTTQFYRSGRIESIRWRQDSSVKYNVLGEMTRKAFGLNKSEDIPDDSTLIFRSNGQISNKTTFKNNTSVSMTYDNKGILEATDVTRHTPSVQYRIFRDKQNILISSLRIDTIFGDKEHKTIQYDTVYFDGKRVFKTGVIGSNYEETSAQYYYPNGSLAETIYPDSLNLVEFKDNVDCYYGLKNRRGDTIVKTRFDNIQRQFGQTWGAYSGKALFLFDRKGAPITFFPPNITGLTKLWDTRTDFSWLLNKMDTTDIQNALSLLNNNYTYPDARLYAFWQGDKSGVVDGKGTVLMSPQSRHLTNYSLFGGTFFHFEKRKAYILEESGFINKAGKPLFPSDAYKTVMYSNYEDYFFLCERPFQVSQGCLGQTSTNSYDVGSDFNRIQTTNAFGLGKSDGTVVLSPQFNRIARMGMLPLFATQLIRKDKNNNLQTVNDGIYNVQSKRWLLDSVGFQIKTNERAYGNYFVVKQLSQLKMGIMDTAGRYVLPLVYDSIGIVDAVNGLFWVKKANKYQLFDIKKGKPNLHKAQYDFLSTLSLSVYRNETEENVFYFYAQRNNKWGIIDANEKIIRPFDYDYAANEYNKGSIMVKNNQADFFTLASLPNPMPDYPHIEYGVSKETGKYALVNSSDRIFVINNAGKVLVPPQYKLLKNQRSSDYLLIQDDAQRKKVVFLKTGAQHDYPFNYTVEWANPYCALMIVKDTAEASYGVVSTDGTMLMPCKNYGIAIGDADKSVFFAKQDTPTVKQEYDFNGRRMALANISADSFNLEDNNWLMYDGKGVLLTNKPFRFPIEFITDVGIGAQDDAFNLYKTDGSVLPLFVKNTEGSSKLSNETPPNVSANYAVVKGFNNILRVDNSNFYALFYNQGLTPTLILTKETGEIVVNSGRYDGISKFYGNYALVTAAGKMGLIDTLGREVIAPQDMRLPYAGNLIDSLNLVNKMSYQRWFSEGKKGECDCEDLPVQSINDSYKTNHPDSLAITPAQRLELWHLLLETTRKTTINTASDVAIERVKSRASALFFYQNSSNRNKRSHEHYKINVETNTLSFILEKRGYSVNSGLKFHNFYRRNKRWESLDINNLLTIQGEKRWQINDLITKKVKALKDRQIDCSNTSAFIAVVENRFMLTSKGVDFYFASTDGGDPFVVISFTWKELSPFLKLSF